jgi:hypothetical protein
MFGQNQAECCSGDQGDCIATSAIATAAPTHEARGADREPKQGD